MPEGLLSTFERQQILDLLSFLTAQTAPLDAPPAR